ncbi:MAG: hypothetical protein IJM59_12220, partial [Proteobacteria bacterium]|nr:hypothetical protein [Pseudomonadota bacterium]
GHPLRGLILVHFICPPVAATRQPGATKHEVLRTSFDMLINHVHNNNSHLPVGELYYRGCSSHGQTK